MIKAGIIGGAGYTGGELLRLLQYHPDVEISFVHSNSQAGKLIYEVHQDLIGLTDLKFCKKIDFAVDVLFLCMGHGRSKTFLSENQIPKAVKVIDLSRDFRLKEEGNPFVYGLPELNQSAISKSDSIANPGCFATCIQLGLLPLANKNLLQEEIHVNAITGSTGAGQNPTDTSHFSWRNNNVSIYKAFEHQHLGEINQSLNQLQKSPVPRINFLPVRGNFSRGIYASIYTKTDQTEKQLIDLYQSFYEEAPFVHLAPQNPSLKQVVNTNNCILFLQKHEDKVLIISMIDNLIKGASGQAIQNMNLSFGLNQKTGLGLKAVAF